MTLSNRYRPRWHNQPSRPRPASPIPRDAPASPLARRFSRHEAPASAPQPTPRPLSLGLWAAIDGYAGLNVHARSLLRAMEAEGLPVVHVGHCAARPPRGQRFTHGLAMGLPVFWRPARMLADCRIGYVVFEAERVPSGWLGVLRSCDRLWTPSRFGVEVLRNSGLEQPIDVVPGGFDPGVFFPGERGSTDGTWRLCAIGKPEGRKNFDGLIAAYRAAFTARDDVVLTLLPTGNEAGRPWLMRMIEDGAGPGAAR